MKTPTRNTLFYGDNLTMMREHLDDESVDLVYLDPPFNSNASYNVLFKAPEGHRSQAQIEAFDDTWHWTDVAERAFDDAMGSKNSDAAEMLRAMRSVLKENDLMAYLAMMTIRLPELRRVLKPTGSLYLHCDPTASHYLKLLLDAIFGSAQFLNEISWKRTGTHSSAHRWGPIHDTILYYCKSNGKQCWNRSYVPHSEKHLASHYRKVDADGRRFEHGELTGAGIRHGQSGAIWRGYDVTKLGRHWTTTVDKLEDLYQQGRIYIPEGKGWPRLIRYEDEGKGRALGDFWEDIAPINMRARERLGYPTQKPLTLLERIIAASSKEGDLVLDPFCGCGTTVHAAAKLNRRWIGIDITHLAVNLIQKRLKDAFPELIFDVVGAPTDIDGARALARHDKYEFQKWVLAMLDAVPYKGGRKGADRGIDGYLYFKPDGKKTEKAVVSVKGGATLTPTMVKDLIVTVEQEEAKLGFFLTLEPPTKGMIAQAAAAGIYVTEFGQFPRIQIIEIERLFSPSNPLQMPWQDTSSFKKTKRETTERQDELDLD